MNKQVAAQVDSLIASLVEQRIGPIEIADALYNGARKVMRNAIRLRCARAN
jgi:hypothetical protein